MIPDMNRIVGSHDLVLITLDSLRFDVAQRLWHEGRTPNLAALIGPAGWTECHSPGSFTYAAHHAFFAGFLPTPATPGLHPRHFAARFEGSVTTASHTCVLDAPDIVSGLAARGYHTVCIGGVGFFNQRTALGRVLPALFHEAHWSPELGVTCPESTANQFALAARILERRAPDERVFLFVNVSAIHQPNHFYLAGGPPHDTLESHAAALEYVDRQLPQLVGALRRPTFGFVLSDHGTCYGDDGFQGHRLAHPAVWSVPLAEFTLEG